MGIKTIKPFQDDKDIYFSRQFTDRIEFKEEFWSSLSGLSKDEVKVITFYGVGGIGKTALRKELMKEVSLKRQDIITAMIDFSIENHRIEESALKFLRANLKVNHKVRFDYYDTAYAIYLKKLQPDIKINNKTLPFLDEGDLLFQLISISEDLPFLGVVGKTLSLLNSGISSINNKISRNKLEQIVRIENMEPKDIFELLPEFFALDFFEHLEKNNMSSVIFVDTYEAIWGNNRSITSYIAKDEWLRDKLIKFLPGVLWVVFSREQLIWDEFNQEWKGSLFQKCLPALEEKYAVEFLKSAGINDIDIQKQIIKNSKGLPYALELQVDMFYEIKRNNQPSLDDFVFKKVSDKIFYRFIKYLNKSETTTLGILSIPRFWDYCLFEKIIKEFETGFPLSEFEDFSRFSFITNNGEGKYYMHSLMRNSLIEYQDKELTYRVNKFLFNYYSSKVNSMDFSKSDDSILVCFNEAFYHGLNCCINEENTIEFFNWFTNMDNLFFKYGLWQITIPLHIELITYFEKICSYPVANKFHACELYNLAYIYLTKGQYDAAEELFEKSYIIRNDLYGEVNSDTAKSIYGLATLYHNKGKYEKAERLYVKSLKIRERVLEKEHMGIALSLNNLATLYHDIGRLDKAKKLYEKSLEIRKINCKYESTEIALVLNNIAILCYDQKDYEEAVNIFNIVLSIRKKLFGSVHSEIARTFNNLGNVFSMKGDFKLARENYEKSLEMRKQVLGYYNIETAKSLNNIAVLYFNEKKLMKSYQFLNNALEIKRLYLEKDHPSILISEHNLELLNKILAVSEHTELSMKLES